MLNEKKEVVTNEVTEELSEEQLKAVEAQMQVAAGEHIYRSMDEMYNDVAEQYIRSQGHQMKLMELRERRFEIIGDIMDLLDLAINARNSAKRGSKKWETPKSLPATIVAKLLVASGDVVLIRLTDVKSMERLAVKGYNEDGTITGIWMIDMWDKQKSGGYVRDAIRELAGLEVSDNQVNICRDAMRAALRKKRMSFVEGYNKDFIVCFNGVYNGRTKKFTAFTDPDYEKKYGSYHFLSKMDTDWNPDAKHPDYFDPIELVRQAMPDGKDGEVQAKLFLHTIQFMYRRYPGKTGWLVSFINDMERSMGKGSKSTLWEMITGAIQHTACDSYALSRPDSMKEVGDTNGPKVVKCCINKWNEDYMLAKSIVGAWVLYSDELREDPIDQDAVKHFARNQSHTFNPKFDDIFDYVFHGIAGLTCNGTANYRDKTDAMYEHQLIFMTDKTFNPKEGTGDANIKAKYICEEETWEYLVYYAATQVDWVEDYPLEIDTTGTMDANIQHLKNANVPTFGILDKIMPGLAMCPRIPGEFVHHLYRVACEDDNVSYIVGMDKFWKDMVAWVHNHSDEYEIDDLKSRSCRNDSIKKKKEYVIDGEDNPVSEWDILFNHVHPSVVAYGHASKQFGQSKYVLYKDGFTVKGQAFGCFDEKAGLSKYSHFIRIKKPLKSYGEYLASNDDDAETAAQFASQMRKREREMNSYKANVHVENESNFKDYEEQQKLISSVG